MKPDYWLLAWAFAGCILVEEEEEESRILGVRISQNLHRAEPFWEVYFCTVVEPKSCGHCGHFLITLTSNQLSMWSNFCVWRLIWGLIIPINGKIRYYKTIHTSNVFRCVVGAYLRSSSSHFYIRSATRISNAFCVYFFRVFPSFFGWVGRSGSVFFIFFFFFFECFTLKGWVNNFSYTFPLWFWPETEIKENLS